MGHKKHCYHRTMKNRSPSRAQQEKERQAGLSLEETMLSMGSPRPKMELNISVNDPKEATNWNLEAFRWHSASSTKLEVPLWNPLGILCLSQHWAQKGPYLYRYFSPSCCFFLLGLPYDKGLKKRLLSKRMNWNLQNNEDGKHKSVEPFKKSILPYVFKRYAYAFDQVILLRIHPTELNLKYQKATYMKLSIHWNTVTIKHWE